MRVVFDAEPLVAFAFDEPGADVVQTRLDEVYDGAVDGYVTTVNLAEFRYVAARRASAAAADDHIEALGAMGLAEYAVDDLWTSVSDLKARNSLSLGDAYAVAAASAEADDGREVTLLAGGDDDFEPFEGSDERDVRVERFRDEAC